MSHMEIKPRNIHSMNRFIYKIVVQYRGNVEFLIKSLASLPLSPYDKPLTSYQSCQLPSVSKFLYSSKSYHWFHRNWWDLFLLNASTLSECMVQPNLKRNDK